MKRHILITGTGRAGTTLLVQILTALGFDTGFTIEQALSGVDPLARAGLEPNIKKDRLAHVIKVPGKVEKLERLFASPETEIELAIVPVRDLFAAAESRRNVYRLAESSGKNPFKHPGSVVETKELDQQEDKLARQFYKCARFLVATETPIFFLDFPRFAADPSYLYRALKPLWKNYNCEESRLQEVMKLVCRPNLINEFSEASPTAKNKLRGAAEKPVRSIFGILKR
jgi:hypothetical protein